MVFNKKKGEVLPPYDPKTQFLKRLRGRGIIVISKQIARRNLKTRRRAVAAGRIARAAAEASLTPIERRKGKFNDVL